MDELKGRIGDEMQDDHGNDLVELFVAGAAEPWHLMIHPAEPKPVKGDCVIAHGTVIFPPNATSNPLMSVRYLEPGADFEAQRLMAAGE
jgi:hypothetical protein